MITYLKFYSLHPYIMLIFIILTLIAAMFLVIMSIIIFLDTFYSSYLDSDTVSIEN